MISDVQGARRDRLGMISGPQRSKAGAGLILFAVATAFYAAWPLWRAFFPFEIDLKEPWNAYHADAAFSLALYPDPAGLVSNNYPPFWYYLTGALGRLGPDPLMIGRALSAASVVAVAVIAARLVRAWGGSRPAAVLAGLLFTATMVRYADYYVAMNDQNITALAVMSGALLWASQGDVDRGRVAGPALLLVTGGFFKHSLVAIPATMVFMLYRRSRRAAYAAAAICVASSAVLLAVLTAIYGRFFLDQVFLYPREMSLWRAVLNLDRLGAVLPAILLWALWWWRERDREPAVLSAALIGFAVLSYLLQKSGAKTAVNSAFELFFAVSVDVGLAFDRLPDLLQQFGARSIPRAIAENAVIGILALVIIAAPGLEPYALWFSSDYRAQFHKNLAIVDFEAARIAAISGPVHCSFQAICRRAGKDLVVDDIFVEEKFATGRLSPDRFAALAGAIRFEIVDPRVSMRPLRRELRYGHPSEDFSQLR